MKHAGIYAPGMATPNQPFRELCDIASYGQTPLGWEETCFGVTKLFFETASRPSRSPRRPTIITIV
jgi:hypothetical protein